MSVHAINVINVINEHLQRHVQSPVLRAAAAAALLRMARRPGKFTGIGDATHEVMEKLCKANILLAADGHRKYRMLDASRASALVGCDICADGFLVPPR